MILKRPFAFFIKHFRLVHGILAVVTAYLAYNTARIISFYNEYMKTTASLIDKEVVLKLFPIMSFIFLFVALVISTIVLFLMRWKKKHKLFYIVNIISNVYMWVVYIYSRQIVKGLEIGFEEVRTLKLVHDFLIIGLIIQGINLVILAIRSTGFDIKKFNFEEDLNIEIDESDSAEFEFDVDVDTDKYKRNIKKIIRSSKYIYKENKLLITLATLVFISILSTIVYFKSGVYNKIYKEGDTFKTNSFSFGVVHSYSTSKDYHGNKITNNRLIVVKVKARNMRKYDMNLETAKIALTNNKFATYSNVNYQGKFIDLGNVYVNSNISQTKFDEYLLVFDLPDTLANQKLYLKYYDTTDKTVTVAISPIELDKIENVGEYSLGKTIDFEGSLMGKTKLTINSVAVSSRFKEDYNLCITDNDCYSSHEYIVPTIADNYSKTLLKVTGSFDFDNNLSIKKMNSIGEFLSAYGKIVYEIDDTIKEMPIILKEVKPKKVSSKNRGYLEVYNELEKATSITLKITVRNKEYIYKLK